MHELAPRIARYLTTRLPQAAELEVTDVERIHGGASRETYRLKLRYRDAAVRVERRLILRRDPPGSLIETDRAIEFAAYRAFHGTTVPVPEALRWWELFSSVKGQAIWISSGREYQSGKNQDPVLALSGWWLSNAQDRAALETMGKLG